MHWLLLALSAVAFAGAVFAPSQGLLVLALLVALGALFGGFMAMVSSRIAERSRPDSMLLTDADVNALRKSVREARAKREAAPAPPADRDSD